MKRIYLIFLFLFLACLGAGAQNVSDLIISEVLADPDSSGIVDGYGKRNGWIEIFNTSQGTVSYGGCFLTDDRNNLHKSLIPKGDNKTKLGPRQTVLFYASGKGHQGTFYADFKVRRGSTIYLVSNDGRTIIDSLKVPANLPVGWSVSKKAYDNKEMDFEVVPAPTEPTPGIPNSDPGAETRSQKMAREDPHGWILTLVSVSVVFAALAILWFLFSAIFQSGKGGKKKTAEHKIHGKGAVTPEVAAAISMALDLDSGGEEYAAIATALHLYLENGVHDEESFVITIRPTPGSLWSDKSLTFRKSPNK